jgi:hypothetical protein|tara:strand:- start:1184 stop:2602 length:1419 start_codon:yes stop_codon:yes gene_type:complete
MKFNSKAFEFVKFDREQIEKEINLKEEAEKDGGLNRPPANAKEKSSAERLGIKKSRELLDKEINKAHNWLTPLIETIDNLSLKIKGRHWNIQATKNRIRENIGKASTTLESQKMIFDKEHQDVESFRNLHGIGRQPKITSFEMVIVQVGIVIFLFVSESILNMNLLATAIGKREGLTYSMSVAGLNVLLSALVGYFILKGAINYENSTKKRLLDLFTIVYVAIIIYINCVLGAIRAISDKTNQEVTISGFSIGQGVDNALAFWTVHWTPLSLVLTFIGILFAVISLVDAYYFKDIYPGYGDAAKKREHSRKVIEKEIDNLVNAKQKIFNNEHSNGNILKKELIEKDLTLLTNESNKIIQIFNGYSDYVFSVQRGIKEILETYRGINGQVRSDKVRPEYWDEKYKMDDHYLKPELKFSNYKDYYYPGNTIQARMVEEQKRITDEHSEYEKALNLYEKEIDNEILELKKKYALT